VGAAVDRRAPVAGVLGDMLCGVALAQCGDEPSGIEALSAPIAPDGLP
jgi:hypothetical protein